MSNDRKRLSNLIRLSAVEIAFLLVSMSGFEPSFAATYTWDDSTSNHLWTDPQNWTPVGVPGVLDSVTFSNQGNALLVNLGANRTVQRVSYNSNVAHQVINGFLTAADAIDIRNGIDIGATANLNIIDQDIVTLQTIVREGSTLRPTTPHTHFGTFVLDNGTLRAWSNDIINRPTISSPISLQNGGGTLYGQGASGLIVTGPVSGGGALHITGNNVTLSGFNSYAGGTIIEAGGVLHVPSNSSLGASGTSVSLFGATLSVTSSFTLDRNLILPNPSSHNIDTTNATLVHTGVISHPGSSRPHINKYGSGTLVMQGLPNDPIHLYAYEGVTILDKSFAAANNSFGASTADLTIFAVVRLAQSNQIGDAYTTSIQGGTLDLQSFQEGIGSVVTNYGTVTGTTGSVLTTGGLVSDGDSAIAAKLLSLPANAPIDVVGGTLHITSPITGSSIQKLGAGSLVMSGPDANIYLGETSVQGGSLILAKSVFDTAVGNLTINSGAVARLSASNQIRDESTVTINSGEFDLTLYSDTFDRAALSNGTINGGAGSTFRTGAGGITSAGSSAINASTYVPLNSASQITVNPGVLTISSTIVDGAPGGSVLRKTGLGMLVLNGAGSNTYSGGTFASGGGSLVLNKSTFDGTVGNMTIDSGTTVRLENHNQIRDASTVALSGFSDLDFGAYSDAFDQVVLSSASISGIAGSSFSSGAAGITSTGGSSITVQTYVPLNAGSQIAVNDGVLTISSAIIDGIPGGSVLRKTGAGQLVLNGSGANAHTGGTIANGGTLVLNKSTFDGAVGNLAVNSGATVRLANHHQIRDASTVTITGGNFDMNVYSDAFDHAVLSNGTISGIAGSSLSSGAAGITSTGVSSITAQSYVPLNADSQIAVNDGVLTISSSIIDGTPGGSVITKTGAGQLILTGANTYSGNTAVQAGKLSLTSPSLANSADVYIANGALLELSFLGSPDIIDSLYLGGMSQAVGIWGAVGSGAQFTSPLLVGTGNLQVTTFVPLLLTGDYNQNGIVDAADYAVWRKNLGQSITLPNDSTPGTVTQEDYDVWRAHFGQTAGSGSGVSANAVVPEPATLLLMILAAAGASTRRHQSR